MLFKSASLLLVLAALAASAQASINLLFSGGEGSPLTVTLATDATFVITETPTDVGPVFILDGFAGLLAAGLPDGITGGFSGGLYFSVNESLPVMISDVGAGGPPGQSVVTDDDLFLVGGFGPLQLGDVVTLFAGSLTTNSNFETTIPADGTYSMFLIDINSKPIAGDLPAVPEPATYAAIAGALGLAFVALRRRKA
ncbi:MAG: PEP-CTERM sorting domain-containing protein [Verrucomicrobiota bacterium JB022]|nr:PEP-CTERM sorting domain-containing protein [Verrucomicrobiota bacterium JB022]